MARITDPNVDAQNATGFGTSRDMVRFDFAEGSRGVWSDSYDQVFDTVNYKGAGGLVSIKGLKNVSGQSASGFTLEVLENPEIGLTFDDLKRFDEFTWRLRNIWIYKWWMMPDTGELIGSPELIARGIMERISFPSGPNASPALKLHCSTLQRIYFGSGGNVSDDAMQKMLDPSDTSYSRIPIAGKNTFSGAAN